MSNTICGNSECAAPFVGKTARANYCSDKCMQRVKYLKRRDHYIAQVKLRYDANRDAVLASRAAHYQANKDAYKAKNHDQYVKHLDERKAKSAEWRAANREECARRTREWREADPERARLSRKRHWDLHKERRMAQHTLWRIANRQTVREGHRRREARLRQVQVVKFTAEQMRQRFALWGHKCWMCGSPADTADHVKPLHLNGPHMLANLRPACKSCNSSKRATWHGPQNLSLFLRES